MALATAARRWLSEDERPGGNPVHGLRPEETYRDPRAVRDLGRCRSLAPKARAPRQLPRARVGVPGDRPACFGCTRAGFEATAAGRSERRPFPAWADYQRNSIWIYDCTHFAGCPRHAVFAVMDLVTRKWITELVSIEETSTQVQVVFLDALEAEGLLELVEARQDAAAPDPLSLDADVDVLAPVLLAVSDNGPQMTSVDTRAFMAMCAIAQHFGRPGTPTDQAWIESLFTHVKADWPHLDRIRDPEVLRAELADVRHQYNTIRLHAGIGYVTPADEHDGRGPRIRAARKRGLRHARWARIAYHQLQKAKANRRSPADAA